MLRRRRRLPLGEPVELFTQPEELDEAQGQSQKQISVYGSKELAGLINDIRKMITDDEDFNPDYVSNLRDEVKKGQIRDYVRRFANEKIDEIANNQDARIPFDPDEKEHVIQAVINEIIGYGPLEPLLDDETINDILVNTYRHVYVERGGKLESIPVQFVDNEHLLHTIRRIVKDTTSRDINVTSPMVDARLDRHMDSAESGVQRVRVNAIIEPLAIEGPTLSIRKFPEKHMTLPKLIDNQTLTEDMANLLIVICQGKLNVLISGGTGSGKTTLLNAISEYISRRERIITIEDTAELHLLQDHVVRLETRPPNPNSPEASKGEITQRDLLKNSLRMRPDRIIVGEVRGNEALDMLQAMNTGHEGSLTTIHANNGRDALARLETMVAMASANTSSHFIRQSIRRAFDVVIHVARLGETRKVVNILEVAKMKGGETINAQEIFEFKQTAVDGEKVRGEFRPSGTPPQFLERLRDKGIKLADMPLLGDRDPELLFQEMFETHNVVYI